MIKTKESCKDHVDTYKYAASVQSGTVIERKGFYFKIFPPNIKQRRACQVKLRHYKYMNISEN